jgi:hypothetical protein
MEIPKIDLLRLRNDEHLQFNTEFKDLVDKFETVGLDFNTLFQAYLLVYVQEDEALQLIRKSATTEQLEAADTERDELFGGFVDAVKSSLRHYDNALRLAAKRFKIALDQYGNISRKSYDEETADLSKLVKEAQTTYSPDIATLGLADWILHLNAKNLAFETLMKTRYSEEADKTEYRMKQVRVEVDASYRTIVKQIDALILVNGAAKYEGFVRELNARVDKYNLILAQREGRNNKAL